jgi:hypothetical protein
MPMTGTGLLVGFWNSSSEAEPVRQQRKEWDPQQDRRRIGEDIKTPLGMTVCRPMGTGLYEPAPEHRMASALFCFHARNSDGPAASRYQENLTDAEASIVLPIAP